MAPNNNIKVVVRIKPQSIENPSSILLPQQSGRCKTLCIPSMSKQFTYDYVASGDVGQDDIFQGIGLPVVNSCLEGFNSSIFCYGATGSGKTHTMTGPKDGTSPEKGLVPRILDAMFGKIKDICNQNSNIEFSVNLSFLEIYKEMIVDLLSSSDETLQLREDIYKGVYVEGLGHHLVDNTKDALHLLRKGVLKRTTGETKMNKKSSRSHSVFTIHIESKEYGEVTTTKSALLNLIDLAGSERQSATEAQGVRMEEACSINKSLSCLGQVIKSLSEGKRKSSHIHYRDSKLTFLLRDCLGGNSKTCIIANVSALPNDVFETISTLHFAQRAKLIKNKPIANENYSGNVTVLQEKIRRLKQQLDAANDRLSQPNLNPPNIDSVDDGESYRQGNESDAEYVKRLERILTKNVERTQKLVKSRRSCYKQIQKLGELLDSREKLFMSARYLLKAKEYHLAKLENRKPNMHILHRDYVPKLDISSNDMSDESIVDVNVTEMADEDPLMDTNKENYSECQLTRAERLMQEISHPEKNPAILAFVIENIEIGEQLEIYQQELGSTYMNDIEYAILHLEQQFKKTLQQKEEHQGIQGDEALKAQLNAIWKEKMEAERKVKLLEEKMVRQTETLEAQKDKITIASNRINELEQYCDGKPGLSESFYEEIKLKYEAEMKEMLAELDHLRKQASQSEGDLVQNVQLAQQQRQMEMQNAKLQRLEMQLSEKSRIEEENVQLVQQIESLKHEIHKQKTMIESLQNNNEQERLFQQVKSLQMEISNSRQEFTQIQEQNNHLHRQKMHLQETITQLHKDNAELQEANTKLQSESTLKQKSMIVHLNQQVQNLELERDSLNRMIDQIVREKGQAREDAREEVRKEIEEEIRNEIQDKVQREIQEKVRQELTESLTSQLEKQFQLNLENKLQEELNSVRQAHRNNIQIMKKQFEETMSSKERAFSELKELYNGMKQRLTRQSSSSNLSDDQITNLQTQLSEQAQQWNKDRQLLVAEKQRLERDIQALKQQIQCQNKRLEENSKQGQNQLRTRMEEQLREQQNSMELAFRQQMQSQQSSFQNQLTATLKQQQEIFDAERRKKDEEIQMLQRELELQKENSQPNLSKNVLGNKAIFNRTPQKTVLSDETNQL